MEGLTLAYILCCVLALGSGAVVPAPAAVVPYHPDVSATTSFRSDATPYHSDTDYAPPYSSVGALDTPYHSEDASPTFNHPDTTPELNEDKKFLGSHLLYVINNNMGSVAAATLGSLFGPFGAYVSAFIQPPISQTMKHFSGGVISRENDESLELLD